MKKINHLQSRASIGGSLSSDAPGSMADVAESANVSMVNATTPCNRKADGLVDLLQIASSQRP